MERRDFLKRALNFFIASAALLSSALLLRFISPRQKTAIEQYHYLMQEDELPRRGVKKVEFTIEQYGKKRTQRIFISAAKGSVTALSPVCTHLGCTVVWDHNSSEFVCPCHAGRYNISGEVISGPPPKPLERFTLRVESGRVFIGWKA
ncbi:MAG: ubiquinol-cytochrome c reductase iron-sulfur subunit [Nitrospiraceae bacterium]|nr:ubiquinol-cytochrome c reductase iron-sulfur subunit [Nitrospiraceae bacterium]